MYIAMNRFRVAHGSEVEFENVWKNRERHLDQVPGYLEFKMLKAESNEEHTLYASHTTWETYEHFIEWTNSDHFKNAHKQAEKRNYELIGGPHFEGFEVILHEQPHIKA